MSFPEIFGTHTFVQTKVVVVVVKSHWLFNLILVRFSLQLIMEARKLALVAVFCLVLATLPDYTGDIYYFLSEIHLHNEVFSILKSVQR